MRRFKKMIFILSAFLISCGPKATEPISGRTTDSVSLSEPNVENSSTSDTVIPNLLKSEYLFQGENFTYPDETVEGFFVENENGLTMTGFGDVDQVDYLVIPQEVNGKKVTEVKIGTNTEVKKLSTRVKIVIPKTLEKIAIPAVPFWSFLYCGNQADWLASSLSSNRNMEGIIDLYFLEGNEFKLVQDLVIDEGVSKINMGAFQWTSIRSLKLPSTVKVIDTLAFAFCGYLSSVELNEGLEEVNAHAFSQCNRLLSLKVPSSVKKLGETCFYAENLLSVEVSAGCTLSSGNLFDAFKGCFKLFRFLNHSAEETPKFSNIKITIDNQSQGDIASLNGYYYGYVNNELTMLTYLGEEKELVLPTKVTINQQEFTSYVIGKSCFYHYCMAATLHPDFDYDYYNPIPVLTSIKVPSSVSDVLGKNTFCHYVRFSEENFGLKELYFDMSKEKVDALECISNIYEGTKVYYQTQDGYVLR